MSRFKYWLFCLRFGKFLTYEQWEFMDWHSRTYKATIGKAYKKALRNAYRG